MKKTMLLPVCLMFALLIAPVAAPYTPYPGTNLDIIAHKIDYVNIGDPSSEAGHNLYGWGPIEPKTHGGGWGGAGFDGNCRVISSGLAGTYDGVTNNLKDWARFTMGFGSDPSLGNKYLLLKSLEGLAKDSFYVYVDAYDETKGHSESPNNPIYYWPGDNVAIEWWVLHEIQVDLTGTHTIYLVSNQPHWSGWGTWGQVAFTWAATESRQITTMAGSVITLDAMAKDRFATVNPLTWSPVGPTFTVARGTTTITITATDSAGDSASKQITVIGLNNPPVAEAGGPYAGYEGSPIAFDASGSSDPDGDILQYRWDFDNDGTWDTDRSSDPTASHTWGDDFAGSVAVEVFDGYVTATDTASVTVNNVAPTVEAGLDQTVYSGETVTFSGTFTDPGLLDTHTISWDFGDGSTATDTLTPTHVYLSGGTYIVTLTVTDDDGGVGSDSLTVTVIPVLIDVKPGSLPNSINLNDRGLLPVAILGSESLNVYAINPETILLGGVDMATRGSAKAPKLAYSYEDVNNDGCMDLVAFFSVQALVTANALTSATTSLTLTASFFDGTSIQGTDTVQIVPP